MRTESGPGTCADQNQTEWDRSRRLIAASEKPAQLHHEIGNTWSISEPRGTANHSKPQMRGKKRDECRRDSLTVPSSRAGIEMDSKALRKGHKHPPWLLCSTTRNCAWLMGLRKPRRAVSSCRKQATCKDRRKRQKLMRLKRIIPSPQGSTGKYRFFLQAYCHLGWQLSFHCVKIANQFETEVKFPNTCTNTHQEHIDTSENRSQGQMTLGLFWTFPAGVFNTVKLPCNNLNTPGGKARCFPRSAWELLLRSFTCSPK